MGKLITTKEFIERANKVHGNKYNYSKTNYIHSKVKVCIICPKHGGFMQDPMGHLHGYGCMECSRLGSKKKVYGVGINDYSGLIREKRKFLPSYKYWASMIMRCYSQSMHRKRPRYKDCTVCEDWLYFSNFKKWFDENYIEGNQLDKDILVKGNKVYSPETCCFVPSKINNLFESSKSYRGKYPIGVSFNKQWMKFETHIRLKDRRIFLGYFNSAEEAFEVYKKAAEAKIKEIAKEYLEKGLIKDYVYKEMIKYEVNIND